MSFKVSNILFSHKLYWFCVGDDFLNHNWSMIYNNPNPVSEFKKIMISLVDRRVHSKVIRRRVNEKIVSSADDTTLSSEIGTPSDLIKISDSLNRDLLRFQTWCSSTTSTVILMCSSIGHFHLPQFIRYCSIQQINIINILNTYS